MPADWLALFVALLGSELKEYKFLGYLLTYLLPASVAVRPAPQGASRVSHVSAAVLSMSDTLNDN